MAWGTGKSWAGSERAQIGAPIHLQMAVIAAPQTSAAEMGVMGVNFLL